MGVFSDLTGEKFGKLTVIKRGSDYISPKGYHSTTWLCKCDCGKETVVRALYLKSGRTASCGCLRVENPNRTTHGGSNSKLYGVWSSMKDRCYNKNNAYYDDYGGRGIVICDEWHEFQPFMEWAVSNGYEEELSIDRIDNNGNYEPSNCRWVDMYVQANNTRHNHLLSYNGKTQTMSQWAAEYGIKYHKLKDRINKCGWTVERALTQK